jgi:hypothetical protein
MTPTSGTIVGNATELPSLRFPLAMGTDDGIWKNLQTLFVDGTGACFTNTDAVFIPVFIG